MWDHDIRLLSQQAAHRLRACREEQIIWKRELDKLHSGVASSQIWLGIATAAIESALFGFLAKKAVGLIATRLFMARAGAIATRAIVAGYSARRVAAGSAVVATSLKQVGNTASLIAALAASLVQVGVKEIYSDQKLGDVLLTLGMSALPPTLFSNIGGVAIVRHGRRTVVRNAFLPLLLSKIGAEVDLSTLELADMVKTFADPAMSPPTHASAARAAEMELLSPDQVRQLLLDLAGEAARVTAQGCYDIASAQETTIGFKAGQDAAAQDYVQVTGRFAAFYSDIEDQLKDVSVTYANCSARVELWQAVMRAFVRLEQAMALLRRDLEIRALAGPQMLGGRILDYQLRAH